jgi:tRNA A-37 threonylcarbamoyl transferase component Bud32
MRTVIHPDYHTLEAFIRQLPATFEREGEVLWAGRNTVKQYTVHGTPLVVKRFKRPNIVQRIAYTFFKKSKAERAYLYAALLREKGIDTPHEVAFIEQKAQGLLQDTYFVSAVCNDPEIRDTLRRPDCPEALIRALAAFLVEVHCQGVMHGDLNLTNILFRQEADGHYHFTLIDTNRSRFLTSATRQDCLHNLRTLTHERPLLRRILTAYCQLRGWDVESSLQAVIRELEGMEKRKAAKKKLLGRK